MIDIIIAECTLRDWILLKGILIDGKLYNSRNFTGVMNASVQFTMVQKSLDEIPIRFHLEPRSIIHLPRFINTKCVFDFPLFLINQFRAFLIWQIDTRNDKIRWPRSILRFCTSFPLRIPDNFPLRVVPVIRTTFHGYRISEYPRTESYSSFPSFLFFLPFFLLARLSPNDFSPFSKR